MTRLLLALALVAGASSAAQAQQAKVVASCGTQALRLNDGSGQFVDQAGNLCTAAGTGSGAGAATAASPNAGGVSSFSRIPSSAASSNLTNAKATAARAYTYQGCNTTASTVYMRLYNSASTGAVTVGTTPVFAGPYAFPANTCVQATSFAADIGISVSAGLTYAFGTAPTDADATALTAGGLTGFQLGFQ